MRSVYVGAALFPGETSVTSHRSMYGPPRPLGDRRCPLPAMGAEAVGSETAGAEAAAGGRLLVSLFIPDGYLSSFHII